MDAMSMSDNEKKPLILDHNDVMEPMRSYDIRDYFINFKGAMTKDFCVETVKQLESAEFQLHSFNDYVNGVDHSHEDDLDVSWSRIPNYDALDKTVWNAIHSYIQHMNTPYFTAWKGFTLVRFNRYKVGTKMAAHVDHIHTMFDGERKGIPTLTILGLLNDDFEGGDLLLWGGEKIDMQAGDIVVFPSCFFYPHMVTTVTKGIRNSFVSWVW